MFLKWNITSKSFCYCWKCLLLCFVYIFQTFFFQNSLERYPKRCRSSPIPTFSAKFPGCDMFSASIQFLQLDSIENDAVDPGHTFLARFSHKRISKSLAKNNNNHVLTHSRFEQQTGSSMQERDRCQLPSWKVRAPTVADRRCLFTFTLSPRNG